MPIGGFAIRRWLAALGWAAAGLWLVLVRYLGAEFPDTSYLYAGAICLGLAALIAIGRQVGKVAAGIGTVAAALIAVGFVVVIQMAGSGAAVGAVFMAMLSGISYGAARSKPIK